MPLSDDAANKKKKYTIEYAKANYKRVPLDLCIDKYEEVKRVAENSGETVNGFIKKAIDERLSKLNQAEK